MRLSMKRFAMMRSPTMRFAKMRLPATPMSRSAALPYVLMLLGAASFAVMAMFTVALKDQVDWQWIAIARTGLAMTFAGLMARSAGMQLGLFRARKLCLR